MNTVFRPVLTVVFCHTLLLAFLVSDNVAQEKSKSDTVVVTSKTVKACTDKTCPDKACLKCTECPALKKSKQMKVSVFAGMPFHSRLIEEKQDKITIKPGHVVAIKVSPEDVTASLVQPGDHIDLLAFSNGKSREVKTVLQGAKVFSVSNSKPTQSPIVCVEVLKKNAEKIVLAQQNATLQVTLVSNPQICKQETCPAIQSAKNTRPEVTQIKEYRDRISRQLKKTLSDIESLSGVKTDGQGRQLSDAEFEKNLNRRFSQQQQPSQIQSSLLPYPPVRPPHPTSRFPKPIYHPARPKTNMATYARPYSQIMPQGPTSPPPIEYSRTPVTKLNPTPNLPPISSAPHVSNEWRSPVPSSSSPQSLPRVSSSTRNQFRTTARMLDQFAADFENRNDYDRADELRDIAKRIREMVRQRSSTKLPYKSAKRPRR